MVGCATSKYSSKNACDSGRTPLLTVERTLFIFLISNFRRVLNAVCFLSGNSPASEVYMPTFRNTLSVPSSQAGRCV
jgi:hypothetical protein